MSDLLRRFIIGDPPSAAIPAVDGAAHLYGFQFPGASTILLAAIAFANLVDAAVPQSGGNAPAPANFLNSSMVSASRGNSRMARSFSSGIKRRRIFADDFSVFLDELRVLETLADRLLDDLGAIFLRRRRQNEGRSGKPEQTEHRQQLVTALRFGEGFDLGQTGKERVLFAFGNLHDNVEIDHFLFDPFGVAGVEVIRVGDRVDLAAQESNVALGDRITGDILSVFETEQRGEDSADGVVGMADGLGAEANAGGGAQFLQIRQTGFSASGQNT